VLTSSSRHRKVRNGGETVSEDDVRVLTSSSRHQKARNAALTVCEHDENGGVRCWRRSENSWETGAVNRHCTTYRGAGPSPKNRPAPRGLDRRHSERDLRHSERDLLHQRAATGPRQHPESCRRRISAGSSRRRSAPRKALALTN